jgi:hypothetical protein
MGVALFVAQGTAPLLSSSYGHQRRSEAMSEPNSKATDDPKKPIDPVEAATRWGLVVLAAVAALGAVLRVWSPGNPSVSERLDQTTLLYLGVAGGLLLLRQVKAFSLGQLKLEMFEKLVEQQQKHAERLAEFALILPLSLPDKEVRHVQNLFAKQTERYHGGGSLREELRRLRSIGLLANRPNRNIADMRDGIQFDLGEYVELTELGRRWAARIHEMQGDGQPNAGSTDRVKAEPSAAPVRVGP